MARKVLEPGGTSWYDGRMPWPRFHRRVLRAPGFLLQAGLSAKDPDHAWPGGRDLGMHGVVLLVRGAGYYRDASGVSESVAEGHVLLLFPGLRHQYGPTPGAIWEEAFADLDGDLVRLLAAQGILDQRQPVQAPPPSAVAPLRRLIDAVAEGRLGDAGEAQWRLHGALLHLARAACASGEDGLEAGRLTLEADPAHPLDPRAAARAAGMGWELFRKRFRARYGMPPARWRLRARCEAAAEQLLATADTVEAIAARSGFCDGAHLRRRFRELLGASPESYRRLHGGR